MSERCLVYNYAKYLEKTLEEERYKMLHLDLEYNRSYKNVKVLGTQKTSYPDLILHEREKDNNNILVIEFKKWNNKSEKCLSKERKKLKAFKNEYGYKLAILIIFDKYTAENVKYEVIY